jgi:U3 small nucleolar RNA-associated protein 21
MQFIVQIHNVKERRLLVELSMLQHGGTIASIVHPSTYLNKFVVGFTNGALELWNFNSKKLLYTFKSHLEHLNKRRSYDGDSDAEDAATPGSVSVTCLEQSPACDVIGVGFSSGDIVLLNLKLDQVLFSFKQKGGSVTSLSFRTDAGAEKCPFVASSSADGRIHIWNLGTNRPSNSLFGGGGDDSDDDNNNQRNNVRAGSSTLHTKLDRKLMSSLEEAHRGPISRVEFVYGEPLLISAGAEDNSLKVWIFDASDGSARLLRSREGHRGAPTRIRYGHLKRNCDSSIRLAALFHFIG